MKHVPKHQFANRSDRTLTILTVARLVLEDGREGLGRIRNISETGLMLETPMLLPYGEWVRAEMRSQQTLRGRVVWARDSRAGLQFDRPIDVAEAIACLPPPPKTLRKSSLPRAPRIAAPCSIDVQVDGQRLAAELVDISQGGAKIVAARAMRRDERLILMVPGLPLKLAIVRWTADAEIGLRFAEPLPFGILTEWLAVRQEGDFDF